MLRENETYKYLGILDADTIKNVEMKEKRKKRIPQEKEKTIRNQTTRLKKDKYLSCLSRKILGIVLKVDQKRTPINKQENEKTNVNP